MICYGEVEMSYDQAMFHCDEVMTNCDQVMMKFRRSGDEVNKLPCL